MESLRLSVAGHCSKPNSSSLLGHSPVDYYAAIEKASRGTIDEIS